MVKVFLLMLIVAPLAFSEEIGWKRLKVEKPRAMWVWDPVKTMEGLPDTSQPVSKEKKRANKKLNRVWDGKDTTVRFLENHKGSRDMLLDFCANKSIGEIYIYCAPWEWEKDLLNKGSIPLEKLWADFNRSAKTKGVKVWFMYYLWDDPNNPLLLKETESILKITKAVHAFNKANPDAAFVGIHGDQEPGNLKVYPGLLENLRKAHLWKEKHAPELKLSQALRPAWLRQNLVWRGKEQTMNRHILDEVDHAALMCYNDNPKVIKKWSDSTVVDAGSRGKKAAIGFELNNLRSAWENCDKETWWEEISKVPLAQRFRTDSKDKSVTFEGAMQHTEARLAKQKGYDRMVIHSYHGYFQHWFGKAPREYLRSRQNGKYVSALK